MGKKTDIEKYRFYEELLYVIQSDLSNKDKENEQKLESFRIMLKKNNLLGYPRIGSDRGEPTSRSKQHSNYTVLNINKGLESVPNGTS